jgi:dolichol-phosphate mannosyltransferase
MVSIVVPVRSEAESISRLFDALAASVTSEAEVLIVYDDERDPTVPEARNQASRLPFELRFIRNDLGAGPANALRAGFAAARGDAVVVVMADLSDDLPVIDRMYTRIAAGDDVVCGSRYMRGGRQLGGPLLKRMLSRAAGISLYWGAGLPTHDATNAFKMYRASCLRSLPIQSNRGFEISMEVTIKAWLAGWRVTELPATWTDRTEGSSKFRLWKWLPRYLHWYVYAVRGRFARARTAASATH